MERNDIVKNRLDVCARIVEEALTQYVCSDDDALKKISEAQAYSLLAGGKRIRPYLVFSLCRAMGGCEEKALPLACALEMIHTYSLIHDDLPCMDNDDYRRGKLTNHKVFGEATAVLAGDALLTKAFGVIASSSVLSHRQIAKAVSLLAHCSGDHGMIGGQMMDMAAENGKAADIAYLKKMHGLKTGALIEAAAKLGCIAAEKEEDFMAMRTSEIYARNIGLAFQVVDDVLDVIGDVQLLGKDIGSDRESDKLTFMKFYSIEGAKEYAKELTQTAKEAIAPFDREGELSALAEYLLNRQY